MTRGTVLAPLVALALISGACGADGTGPDPAADLAAAQALWESHDLDEYRFVATGWNMGGELGRFLVTVTTDRIDSVMLSPPTVNNTGTRYHGTVENGFVEVGLALHQVVDDPDWKPGYLIVTYDPVWGFPIHVREDDPRVSDGSGGTIEAFAPLGEPLRPTGGNLPCGYRLETVQEHPDDDPAVVERAVRVAMLDPVLVEFLILLERDRCHAARVMLGDPETIVEATFGPPLERDQWPFAVCGDDPEQVGTIRWTVDLDQEVILSVCGY